MKYHNQGNYRHQQPHRIGILLTNLGTPEHPDSKHVRKFLKEFLSDPRVVETPRILWWFILNLIILPTRSKRSARAYQKIWNDKGSPLMEYSKQQFAQLKSKFSDPKYCVELAMRYGKPSIPSALGKLRDQGANQIVVLPLYPQYSSTTTASTFDAVACELSKWRWIPELQFINHYHDHPKYIDALAHSVTSHWQVHQRADILLMSFHGIPQDYFQKGDPYHCQCIKTARLLAERLGLSEDQWIISFQSRLGPKTWLQPYTDKTLVTLAKEGKKSVQVICPGFSSDCLETLEEIAIENKSVFMQAGGEHYQYIPCLNDTPIHIDMMHMLIEKHIGNWIANDEDPDTRAQMAFALGAKI